MADIMNLAPKRLSLSSITSCSWLRLEQLKEFLSLLSTKIECDFKIAESLEALGKFELSHLLNTPFEGICKSIIRKANNESYQTFELVESLKNSIYDPLTDKVKEFKDKIEEIEDFFENQGELMAKRKEKLTKLIWNYKCNSRLKFKEILLNSIKESQALTDLLQKCGFTKTKTHIDDKSFESLGKKIKETDKKAKDLKLATETLNDTIEDYRKGIKDRIKGLEEMEEERIRVMVDALNQINIFQTNHDMNNKYDSNNFNESVEGIVCEPMAESYRSMLKENDISNIDTYSFQPFDELASKDDFYLSQIDNQIEDDFKLKVKVFIDQCFTQNFESKSSNINEFNELMNDKVCRFSFINLLIKRDNFELDNENCFNGIGQLINSFLNACCKNNDFEYLRSVLTLCNKFYYDVKESEDCVIRTHLSETIRGNSILNDSIIWTKAIIRDFRDIIKVFKLPEDQSENVDKETILLNVLFNRVNFYISNLSYLEMDPAELSSIYNKLCHAYKFTTEQKENLKKNIQS